ncbi:biliverdin-producing heme oxygenase [Phytomonospora sp. NPDC050363]|uniref:biliverdin-producing heme oxygenase n=1 Tax=Phytomonospora sp. NPDC050363 TaxID=3155642 RepID=UPI0033EC2749
MTIQAPPENFSARVRKASWAKHQGVADDPPAEPTEPGVLGALFEGELHLGDYTAWHAQQYFVYDALDSGIEALAGDPVTGRFFFPGLSRLSAFAEDLALLIGPDWRSSITPLPTTQSYVDRLREVAASWPAGLVAHQYTRYLGDMSGGQAFRAAANDLYGFDDGPGVRFYNFDGLGDLGEWKAAYRTLLDELPIGEEERQRFIDEVLAAYDFNGAVLGELAANMRRSV